MLSVGIIGSAGVVGSAVRYGMEKLGHKVSVYDPADPNSKWEDILKTKINFLCVPSPSREDGSCDTTIVELTVANLFKSGYEGVIAIKSTVTPGTTKNLIDKYNTRDICFVPEFLKERSASYDFVENHDVCIIGTLSSYTFNLVKEAHGKFPKKFVQVNPTEAEFCKYFNNVYNATLVVFANSMYELCKNMGVDYTIVKNTIVERDHITDIYLDCNEKFRAYSGPCLIKDTLAMKKLAEEVAPHVEFFKNIDHENNKYKKTVWPGMRE